MSNNFVECECGICGAPFKVELTTELAESFVTETEPADGGRVTCPCKQDQALYDAVRGDAIGSMYLPDGKWTPPQKESA